MKKQIFEGTQEIIEIKNESIRGFSLPVVLQHDTLNTAFSTQLLFLKEIYIQARIKVGDKVEKEIIPNMELRHLMMLQAYCSRNGFVQFYVPPTGETNSEELVEESVSAYNKVVVPLYYDFGENRVINLKGNRWLEVIIKCKDGAFHANADATSYIGFETIRGVGRELVTPVVGIKALDSSQPRFEAKCGDFVDRLMVEDFDLADSNYLETHEKYSQLSLKSDKVSWEFDTPAELFTYLYSTIEIMIKPIGTIRNGENYPLYISDHNNGVPLHDVELSGEVVTANLEADENYVVWQGGYAKAENLTKVARKVEEHYEEGLAKFE